MCHNEWTTLRFINTRRFTVALQYQYDNGAYLVVDSATNAGIARGDYAPYTFRVVVLWGGREIGADYLSESIYSDPAEFAEHHYGTAGTGRAADFPQMLRAAVAEARATLAHAPYMRIPQGSLVV